MSNAQIKPDTPVETTALDQDAAIGAILAAATRADSLQDFLAAALGTVAAASGSTFAILEAPEGSTVIQLEHDCGSSNPDFWRAPLRELLSDAIAENQAQIRLFQGKATGVCIGLFALPIFGGGGALTLTAPCKDESFAHRLAERLEALAALVSVTASSLNDQPHRAATASVSAAADSAAQGLRRSADYESAAELAITITNKLASREGFEQVALGRVRGKHVKLLAISGQDHIEKKSESVEVLEQAMHECLDLGRAVAHQAEPWLAPPSEEGAPPTEVPLPTGRLHQHWHESAGRVPVATILLGEPSAPTAVLTVRRTPSAALGPEELDGLEKMVSPFAAALPVIERASQGLIQHATSSLLQAPLHFFSRHSIGKKLVLLAFAALAAWSWFGRLEYRVTTTSSLEPLFARTIGMPVDAQLTSAPLAPGARVLKGSILAAFDTRGLVLEQNRLESELSILSVQENQAVADGNPIDVQLGQASASELQANLALVRHQIELATIRAPFDGVLVEGDLRERIGDSFVRGEPLFRVADTSSFRLKLWIEEQDIDVLSKNQTGSFSAFARPETEFPLTVTRIAPSAEKHNDVNTFQVEAEVELTEDWARSGMQGIARVDIGQRRPLWIWLHGVVEGMRMRSWL